MLKNEVVLKTGPFDDPTHWKQTILVLPKRESRGENGNFWHSNVKLQFYRCCKTVKFGYHLICRAVSIIVPPCHSS